MIDYCLNDYLNNALNLQAFVIHDKRMFAFGENIYLKSLHNMFNELGGKIKTSTIYHELTYTFSFVIILFVIFDLFGFVKRIGEKN